ncbi:MAG: hypothetical protein JXR40_05335 [Pontiellaceae bacterium]|nr:hypothetical protein [Pontiellaceae bacterium]
MNTKFLTLILIGLTAGFAHAQEPSLYHDFTDTQGHSIRAQIIGINLEERTVQLHREDGVEAWVGVNALSSEDLAYIEAWYASSLLISDDNLLVSVMQDQGKTKTVQQENGYIRETTHFCELTIGNFATEPMENLYVEYYYCIGSTDDGQATLSRVEQGFIKVGNLAEGERVTVKTDDIVLSTIYEIQNTQTAFGTSTKEVLMENESVLGISFRVYGSGTNGVLSVREFSTPNTLASWTKDLPQLTSN